MIYDFENLYPVKIISKQTPLFKKKTNKIEQLKKFIMKQFCITFLLIFCHIKCTWHYVNFKLKFIMLIFYIIYIELDKSKI